MGGTRFIARVDNSSDHRPGFVLANHVGSRDDAQGAVKAKPHSCLRGPIIVYAGLWEFELPVTGTWEEMGFPRPEKGEVGSEPGFHLVLSPKLSSTFCF